MAKLNLNAEGFDISTTLARGIKKKKKPEQCVTKNVSSEVIWLKRKPQEWCTLSFSQEP